MTSSSGFRGAGPAGRASVRPALLVCACALATQRSAAQDTLRLEVTRDTWVSTAPGEDEGNNGGATRLKTKSCQELTLFDLDPASLVGRVIERADLWVRKLGREPQRRVTVSGVATAWNEGASRGYAPEIGAASFRWAEAGRRRWTEDGGDLCSVILGAGHTAWSFADASEPNERGWQRIAVDPRVLATRVASLSRGFALFDDVGSEYERKGEAFEYHPFPNRFLASRESGDESRPYWIVRLGATDREAPEPVQDLEVARDPLVENGLELSWTVPADHGKAGILGFFVRFTSDDAFDWDRARVLAQRLIPLATEPGSRLSARLPDLRLSPGTSMIVGVRAVDAAANLSGVATIRATPRPAFAAPALDLARKPGTARAVAIGPTAITIEDALAKIELETGTRVPNQVASARLWKGASRRVQLSGARNEFVDFQLCAARPFDTLHARIELDDPELTGRLYAAPGVATANGRFVDPLVPWDGRIPLGQAARSAPQDHFACALVEIFVGHGARSGAHACRLVLESGGVEVALDLALHVFPFTLPDHLSFVPEMNAYELPPPPEELAWYRLAHEHRACLNVLRYDWRGRVHPGCAPIEREGALDWTAFDARFGPLLDGSAFASSARKNVPVDAFYLPLNENWPVPIEPHFRGGYWADSALDSEYWAEFERRAGEIAAHLDRAGWHETILEFYLNDKIEHKGSTWSGSSAPWIFDEPTHTQDFFALRCFASAFQRGIAATRGDAQLAFRADISRPEWQRDFLDGLLDVAVVGNALIPYRELVLNRKRANGEILMRYATANAVEASNAMPAAWCIDTWCLGGDGVIPWQTIGTERSWSAGDALALFYPGAPAGVREPCASLRLKAFRRGQQDVEYLVLWSQALGLPRETVAARVASTLALQSTWRRFGSEDAGALEYPAIDGGVLLALRRAVGRQIEAREPIACARLVERRTRARDPSSLRPITPAR